jgi:hypothetical protein
MIVMMMARTPSLNASSRLVGTATPAPLPRLVAIQPPGRDRLPRP